MGTDTKIDVTETASNSVLGVDPPKPEAPKPEVKEAPKPEAKVKTVSEEEYLRLAEEANNYRTIASDPQLSSMVRDHFRGKVGQGTPAKAEATPPADSTKNELPKELDELRKGNEAMRMRLAQIELRDFQREHPDMENVKGEMANFLTRFPGATLADAYRFAKAGTSQTDNKKVATAPTTETRSVDNAEVEKSLVDVENEIADTKATPSFDKAIEKAFAAAKKFS